MQPVAVNSHHAKEIYTQEKRPIQETNKHSLNKATMQFKSTNVKRDLYTKKKICKQEKKPIQETSKHTHTHTLT